MSSIARRSATLDEFFAIPEDQRFHELIGGEIVQKADPSGEHVHTHPASAIDELLPHRWTQITGPTE